VSSTVETGRGDERAKGEEKGKGKGKKAGRGDKGGGRREGLSLQMKILAGSANCNAQTLIVMFFWGCSTAANI